MAVFTRDQRREEESFSFRQTNREDESPSRLDGRREDYGDYNIVTRYDVEDSPHRSGPVGIAKETALELSSSKWYTPKELALNVFIVLAFLAVSIIFVVSVDALLAWLIGLIS